MKDIKLAALNGTGRSQVAVGGHVIGAGFTIIAGPCSVESEEQIIKTAECVKSAGAHLLRGGAFKPRSSPYAFQGLGKEGLRLLEKARQHTGLAVVSEVLDPRDVGWISEYVDMLQIGARNMQNFPLLREVGRSGRPVLLKRGMHSTIEEWLLCAEYIMSEGNKNIVLCERGVRTHERYTRNTLDLSAVPAVKELSHLPIITDPSHGTGRRSLVGFMSRASLAAGADGVMLEVHHDRDNALSDRDQTLSPQEFSEIAAELFWMEKILSTREQRILLDAANLQRELRH